MKSWEQLVNADKTVADVDRNGADRYRLRTPICSDGGLAYRNCDMSVSDKSSFILKTMERFVSLPEE